MRAYLLLLAGVTVGLFAVYAARNFVRRHDNVRPPVVPGVDTATSTETLRFAWWQVKGFVFSLHGTRHGGLLGRAIGLAGLLGSIAMPTLPLAVAWSQITDPRTRVYTDGAASLAATSDRAGRVWTITSHVAAHPGRGEGRALRQRLIHHLREQVDQAGVVLEAGAASRRLAEVYQREVWFVVVPDDTANPLVRLLTRGAKLRYEPTTRPRQR